MGREREEDGTPAERGKEGKRGRGEEGREISRRKGAGRRLVSVMKSLGYGRRGGGGTKINLLQISLLSLPTSDRGRGRKRESPRRPINKINNKL